MGSDAYSVLIEHPDRCELNSGTAEIEHLRRRNCTLLLGKFNDIIKMLLAVTEDRATQRCDLSADYGDFKAESDAVRCRSFLFAPLSAENHKALNL